MAFSQRLDVHQGGPQDRATGAQLLGDPRAASVMRAVVRCVQDEVPSNLLNSPKSSPLESVSDMPMFGAAKALAIKGCPTSGKSSRPGQLNLSRRAAVTFANKAYNMPRLRRLSAREAPARLQNRRRSPAAPRDHSPPSFMPKNNQKLR